MRPLVSIERDHKDLYQSCVGQTKSAYCKQMLLDMTDRVVAAGNAYVAALQTGRPDTVAKMPMSVEEQREISKVYDARLVSKTGIERHTYDQVKALVGKCPYCGFGEVWEVDHYLPKNTFPELNILPKNLVPICHPCNHIKLMNLPEASNKSLLHPYFDNLPMERWLFADLTIEEGGPVLEYHVRLDSGHGAISERLGHHFEKLKLSHRMKVQSAQILVEIQATIEEFLGEMGPDGLKEHFQSAGEKIFRTHGNTMEMAAYFAAAENENYCSGAYRS